YTYLYDAAGRLIRTDDPMGRLQEYSYDLGLNSNLEFIPEHISESENL
ncbi:MAG: RHS repeat protein, partial [Alistipes sp.]|nr:RHS repeat protein [Alistipes sp.]